MDRLFLFLLYSFLFLLLSSCQYQAQSLVEKDEMINGVCLVAPRDSSMLGELAKIKRISPNYVAVTPYAFKRKGESRVNYYKINKHWWGEGIEGCRKSIRQLKSLGLKVMLKPHVWVVGDGWSGDFDPAKRMSEDRAEMEWKIWEDSYRDYILTLTEVAVNEGVEIFCIGTEYRMAVQKRAGFWKQLIKDVRLTYKGKITYAANWDNYHKVPFWKEIDYIGIDAYFPLSESKIPMIDDLLEAWKPIKTAILSIADSCNKPLLFTEYGYRSIAYTARGDWKNNDVNEQSEEAQANAYQALFSSWWNEPQLAGGFLWKWHPSDSVYQLRGAEGRFSPQGKEVEEVILNNYRNY